MARKPRPRASGAKDAAHAKERSATITVIVQLLNEEWDINIADWLLERLVLLARHTETTADETSAMRYAGKVFAHVAETAPERAYRREERMLARIGSLFSDIGKTGPPDASPDQQELVVRMFAVENVPDRETVSLASFLKREPTLRKPWVRKWRYRLFPPIWRRRLLRLLRSLGIDPHRTTLRELHDLHSVWTLDLLLVETSGIPRRAVPAAACHHRLRGDNPRGILDDEDRCGPSFGTNAGYRRPEKLVTILDLYDAYRHRSGLNHQETIAALLALVRESPYRDDPDFQEILADVNAALADEEEDRDSESPA